MLFSAPVFLWGLLAVLIPVAVHLFNFRRYRKIYFSNVDRLAQLHTESHRQNRLRQWLVLALRVLAIVCLVLAFAQPVVGRRDTQGALKTSDNAVSIYIDNTFSMGSASSDGSQLDDACRKAREIADIYGIGSRYQLLTADMDGAQMRWLNRDELLEAVDQVQLSPASPLLSSVAKRQQDFLRQSNAATRHAYILSDFQRSGCDLDALPEDSLTLTTLVPLGGIEADNVYIDTLRLDAPAYFAGGAVEVEATLRNHGSHAAEKVPVRLLVDGRERAIATVDLAAGATGKATLRFTIDSGGWSDGLVEISDYPVTFDDRYYFSLCTGDHLRILEAGADKPNSHLHRLLGTESDMSHTWQPAGRFQFSPDYDFIVLNGTTGLTSGDAQQLAAWVGDGGSLLVIAPDGTKGVPATLNDALALLGAPQLGHWLQHPTKASSMDLDHRLYRGVFNGRNDEMEMPSVQGHYALAGAAARQSVIDLADGGSLLTHTPVGAGHIYLFTCPLDAQWTDFVAQALFVPTVYNMALYSRPLPPASHTLGAEKAIVLQGTYAANRQPPELSGPDDLRLIPDLRRSGNRQLLMLHGELTAAGIYRLADEHLAFNHPRRESQLDFHTASEVSRTVGDRQGYRVALHPDKPLGGQLTSGDSGRQLWRLFVVLALAALAAETALLALGRRKTKNP